MGITELELGINVGLALSISAVLKHLSKSLNRKGGGGWLEKIVQNLSHRGAYFWGKTLPLRICYLILPGATFCRLILLES